MTEERRLREIKDDLNRLGVAVTEIFQTRKHLKIYLQFKNRERMFVRSLTPSDGRANLNFLGDVKRWMRGV